MFYIVSSVYGLVAVAFFLARMSSAVDITMEIPLLEPSASVPPTEDRRTSVCRRIPPGRCCNNIFFYRRVSMGGLAPGDLAFAFHRDMWSLGLAVDQRDRRPYEKAAKMYGCAGAAVDGGLGDFEGRWHYEGRGVGSASGAMWLNCAGDPEGAIRTAFRPRVPDAARGSLGRVAKVFVDECRYYLPFHNKRASPGKASASGIVPEASPQDMLNDSENVAGAPDARPVNTRDSSPEATNASPPSAEVWVLPDLVTYNGTRYVARKRGELKYYDDKGMLLNLTLVHADVAAAEAAASAQVPTPRLHSRRG